MHRFLFGLVVLTTVAGNEPAPRALKRLPLRIDSQLTHISAVREIPDGRVLISNAKGPSVLLLDPVKGSVTAVGSAGGGTDRYAGPGGLYAGPDGTTLLVDRAQTLVFTISPAGELQGSRSIARRGVSSSSDEDVDHQRVDAEGLTYFVDRHRKSLGAKELPLVRLDPATQKADNVAWLRVPEMRTISAGNGLTLGRSVVGSPADGWGVAPDGRIAVVRAEPYRVEWISPAGQVRSGPVIEYSPLPMTDADKRRFTAKRQASGVGIGAVGGTRTDLSKLETLFAATKPAFEPDGILVSPDTHVWVRRTNPLGAKTVTYDVFDEAGRRVDRIEFPHGATIVGFGRQAVYARYIDDAGRCELRKYGWK